MIWYKSSITVFTRFSLLSGHIFAAETQATFSTSLVVSSVFYFFSSISHMEFEFLVVVKIVTLVF